MHKFWFLLPLFITSIAYGQPKGYAKVGNEGAFQASFTAASNKIQTLSSDFNQVKNMSLLSEQLASKGKFYLKKDSKVRIQYTSPFSYILVMNDGQVMVKDEQKSSRVNTKNSKAMQSVNNIIIDCMGGTIFNNKDFDVTVYQSSTGYLLKMVPVTAEMKKLFKDIEVYLDKGNFDVKKLVMNEVGGDYTDMTFVNIRHNVPLNESLFKVK